MPELFDKGDAASGIPLGYIAYSRCGQTITTTSYSSVGGLQSASCLKGDVQASLATKSSTFVENGWNGEVTPQMGVQYLTSLVIRGGQLPALSVPCLRKPRLSQQDLQEIFLSIAILP